MEKKHLEYAPPLNVFIKDPFADRFSEKFHARGTISLGNPTTLEQTLSSNDIRTTRELHRVRFDDWADFLCLPALL